MNFSIYLKLLKAYYSGQVKISSDYKHLQFITDKEYFEQIPTGEYQEILGVPIFSYSDYYSLTTKGKESFFTYRTLFHTRVISWLALIISFLALFK